MDLAPIRDKIDQLDNQLVELLNQRLAHAQGLLEKSAASIDVVAQEAGFGTALSLRQHFRANLQTSPSAYRKLFRQRSADGMA